MVGSLPLVSVTLITHNHEKYIGQAIQSVLDQTHRDLEVVVVNDGSTDNTANVIAGFSDPRVRAFSQANQGPSTAANRVLSECRGKYLAVMSGDDLLPPDRIEKQLGEYRKGGSRILFGQVAFIDEDGRPTDTDYYSSNLTPAKGRAKVLRRLFDGMAPAFILTLFTETGLLKQEAPYCDPALYQLQDYDLLIRLAKKYDFHYQNEKVYRFRLRSGHVNLSGPDPAKIIRTRNEFYLILRSFFDGVSVDLFKQIFPDLVKYRRFSTPIEYLCEQAFVMLHAPTTSGRLIGMEKLYDLLRDSESREVLERVYSFTHMTFADMIKSMDTEKLYRDQSQLFIDTGNGFNEREKIVAPADLTIEDFAMTFDIGRFGPVKAVRWDPVEGSRCQVRLESIVYQYASGKTVALDPSPLLSNGLRLPDGTHDFDTTDPMYFLPIHGDVAVVTVQGRWRSPPTPYEMELKRRLDEKEKELEVAKGTWNAPPTSFPRQVWWLLNRSRRQPRKRNQNSVFR